MSSSGIIFSLHNAILSHSGIPGNEGFDLDVHEGECWWICGANGTGKTTLIETVAGRKRLAGGKMILPDNSSPEKFYASVAYIPRDFSLLRIFIRSANFYQQRYFSVGVEESPTVIRFIEAETGIGEEEILASATLLKIDCLLGRNIVSLSTGEGRRILLLMMYLAGRTIICFDDPYSGLDNEGRELVSHTITAFLEKKLTIMITGAALNPPDFISHVLFLKDGNAAFKGKAKLFTYHQGRKADCAEKITVKRYVPDEYDYDFRIVAGMKNITIQYNGWIIQKDFSWKISRGDKWMLTGPNGSGKSTLMSLIYGDNPMAYAYGILLFDRVRGTGETIWEIKSRIGYFSSELQHFFPLSMTLSEAILTGFSDHLAVRRDLKAEHHHQADSLIDSAGLTTLKKTPLFHLSFSQRRLALICRALVKLPPVVILDEPCQGLDHDTSGIVNRLVDITCSDEFRTLIYVTHQPENVPEVINRHLDLSKASLAPSVSLK